VRAKKKRNDKEPSLDKRQLRAYIVRMGKKLAAAKRPLAIGYTRVSTGKQADKGGSLSVQRDRIAQHAVLSGYELVGVFEDAGVSGAKSEEARPAFAAALDTIRHGEASVLIVTDVDRFSRSGDEAGHARVEIRRAGGRVDVIAEAAADPYRIAVNRLLADLERVKIQARMRTWAAARRAKGLPMGFAPYGCQRAADGRLEAVASEAPVVERIRSRRAAGASLRAIVAELNADGVSTRSGKGWNAQTVNAILERAGA
jgi:site-specific DNA recombinase